MREAADKTAAPSFPLRQRSRFYEFAQTLDGLHARRVANRLAIFEQDKRWNSADAETCCNIRTGVNVHGVHAHLAFLFLRQLFHQRCEHTARTAPNGREIDKDTTFSRKDKLFELLGWD